MILSFYFGTYSKVVTNETGHVVEGLPLEGDDLPEHSGDLITSGELNGQLLRDLACTCVRWLIIPLA